VLPLLAWLAVPLSMVGLGYFAVAKNRTVKLHVRSMSVEITSAPPDTTSGRHALDGDTPDAKL
jgi:hypothetical protein